MSLKSEHVEGHRFDINLGYHLKPLPEKLAHPAYKELVDNSSISVGRIIPFSEAGFTNIPVLTHRTTSLEVKDRTTNKTVNVLKMLPLQWEILTVEFQRDFFDITKMLGQDMESPSDKWRLERRMPLFVFGDKKIITLPIYRVKREERLGIDETVEHIIHNVGVSHALGRGLSKQREVFNVGLQYLRDTFGGLLMMDQVK